MLLPKLRRPQLMRILVFLLTTVLIYIFAPTEQKFSPTYDVNKPWGYDDLIAPFDVPVYHTPERQAQLEDSLRKNFKPIYVRDNSVGQNVLTGYDSALDSIGNLKRSDRNLLSGKLRHIYTVGVIDNISLEELGSPGQIAMLTADHKSEASNVGGYYTPHQAYAAIDSIVKARDLRVTLGTSVDLAQLLEPNIRLDSVENERFRREQNQQILAAYGVIPQGETIVSRGEKISPQTFVNISTCLKMADERGENEDKLLSNSRLGIFLLTVIMVVLLFWYLRVYRQKIYGQLRYVVFLCAMMAGFCILAFVLAKMFDHGVYLVPFVIMPIVILVFLDSRTAFFAYTVAILTVASMTHFMWDFIVLQLVAGFVALVSIDELSKRSQLIRSAAMVFLAYSLTFVCVILMQSGTIEHRELFMFGMFGINAVFISFAYILIFLVEKAFGFVSKVTLVELSDINNPVLRELSEECPGTFQHSMAVSNLAASAAARVGANVQLVRAGALYHDIGKMGNPAFFTENQHGINPHDALTPIQSARIVIGHVAEGVRRAEKAKLPSRLRDFILEHHGRGKARFFYTTYCNAHPGEEVDAAPFTYPGPNPQSLETSILMMADAVEAASRSLKDHSPESIQSLVDRIIDYQISEGLHNDSPLSFRDITLIKRSFASTLRTMYHSRISYPEERRNQPTAN